MKTITYLTITALTILVVLKAIGVLSVSWWIVGVPFYFIFTVIGLYWFWKDLIEEVIKQGK